MSTNNIFAFSFTAFLLRELYIIIIASEAAVASSRSDEFAILLENCDVEKATSIAECLIARVDKFSLNIEGNKVAIAGCSIGINEFFDGHADFDEKVRQTDSACYTAKNNGKNQIHIFAG